MTQADQEQAAAIVGAVADLLQDEGVRTGSNAGAADIAKLKDLAAVLGAGLNGTAVGVAQHEWLLQLQNLLDKRPF